MATKNQLKLLLFIPFIVLLYFIIDGDFVKESQVGTTSSSSQQINNDNIYLSIVMCSRNDHYGGDPYRFQRTLYTLGYTLDKYVSERFKVELIIAEWNPPDNMPLLHEEWDFKISNNPDILNNIRIIQVSNEIHNEILFEEEKKSAILEYDGKNVGIRRARGKFVLCTNIDIIFSNDLIKFFSLMKLEEASYYRIQRTDIKMFPRNQELTPAEMLEYATSHEGGTWGFFQNRGAVQASYYEEENRRANEQQNLHPTSIDNVFHGASGDFILATKASWFAIHGYPEEHTFSFTDSIGCCQLAALPLTQRVIGTVTRKIYHQAHMKTGDAGNRKTASHIKTCEKLFAKEISTAIAPTDWGLAKYGLVEYRMSATGTMEPVKTSALM